MKKKVKEKNTNSKELSPEAQLRSDRLAEEYTKKYIEDSNPFLDAGIISRTFYGWMNPILRVSFSDPKSSNLFKFKLICSSYTLILTIKIKIKIALKQCNPPTKAPLST